MSSKKTMNTDHRPWWEKLANRRVQFAADLMVLAAAFWFAYLLRFDFVIPGLYRMPVLIQLPYVVLFQFAALNLFGAYTLIWRYVGLGDIKVFVKAALLSVVPILVLRLTLPEMHGVWRVPITVIVVDTVLAFGSVLLMRVLRRSFYENYERQGRIRRWGPENDRRKDSVLLIGAGRAGVLAAREIQSRPDANVRIRGFIDDDPQKQGALLHGIKVIGTTKDLPRLASELEIDHVIITIANASRQELRHIIDVCEGASLKVRIIPSYHDVVQGKVEVSNIRDVQIEDLLGRDPVQLDDEVIGAFLAGKTVMVTGAGGSIGSELTRQISRFNPARLLLVERAEFVLFNIDRELRESWPELTIIPLVADVGDEARMRSLFAEYRPQVVLHAAAHKHVPMMESNPSEAVKNNILATKVVGELAGAFDAEAFVMISTDKAVRPTSVMGASKRVAELVVQDLNRRFNTRYVAVRFGNVIGSAGSVLTIFREQIRKGGPVTVTHADMVRYFMTIPEASQLVLEAGAIGGGGEIFILDMGEPVKIMDLARDMITLSGLRPYEDIDIQVTGMRPGEKLFEELEITEEAMSKTRHPKIFIGRIAAYPTEKVRTALEKLRALAMDGRERELRQFINELLPEATITVEAGAATKAAASQGQSFQTQEKRPDLASLTPEPA